MGIKCIGLEKDNNIFLKCKENLSKYKGWKLITGDACKLDKFVSSVDYVATEPYMGPFLKKIPK